MGFGQSITQNEEQEGGNEQHQKNTHACDSGCGAEGDALFNERLGDGGRGFFMLFGEEIVHRDAKKIGDSLDDRDL